MVNNITFNKININFDVSKPNWQSNQEPFMSNSQDLSIIKDNYINLKLSETELSDDIKNFYKIFGSSSQEIYINEWTLFSLDNIIYMHNNYIKDNINIYDLGIEYLGMGHVNVAFYDPVNKIINYRHDGGSNGYEREYNYQELKNYYKKNITGYTFTEFINTINNINI
jgi:hypothetical protein